MVARNGMGTEQWALLVALSLLWGGSFLFVGIAVRELPPLTIVALRVGLAAAALLAVIHFLGLAMPKDRRTWAAFFAMGFLNNLVPFTLIVWGQTQITSGLAAILNATTPLFAAMLAHLLTADEKMTAGKGVGIVVGFAGVVLMIGPSAIAEAGRNALAQGAVLAAAFSYALAGLYGRRFRRMALPPLVTATGQVTASTVMLLPLALMVERPWHLHWPSAATWSAVLGLALLSTALAYVLYFRILSSAGAINLMLVTFLIPISSLLLGAAVLGEGLELKHAVGMAGIAVGLIAIDGRVGAWLRARRPRRRDMVPPGPGARTQT